MKRMIKAAEERGYDFSDLSDTAKWHALKQQDIIEYIDYLSGLEEQEGFDSLKYALDSVECRLTRNSFSYGINRSDYDIELTPRGEDIFSVAGLDGSYQVELPTAEGDGLYVGEAFVDAFIDSVKAVKKEVDKINADILEYLNSSEDAEDNLSWDDDGVPEIYAFNERLYDIGKDYVMAVKVAADAAVSDWSQGVNSYLDMDIEDARYILDDSAFVFDIDGNVI